MGIAAELAVKVKMAVVQAPTFVLSEPWRRLFETLIGVVDTNTTALAAVPGVHVDTLANQPTTLGASDEGYLFGVSDYGHLVRWSGSVWEWAPGDDGNGYFRDFAVAPTGNGWQLCDGTATTYLIAGGATLTTGNLTTPDLSGTPAYRKSASSYSGSIVAAGNTGNTAPDITGETANESSHTHTFTTGNASGSINVSDIDSSTFATPQTHTHSGTTSAGSAHKHGVGTLAVDSHHHTAGDPAHLNVTVYFRR